MTDRRTPIESATSTQSRAVQSYYPFYPPPVIDQSAVVHGSGFSGFTSVPLSYNNVMSNAGIVNRKNLRMGEQNYYRWGGVLMRVFRMVMTGGVESSRAQQYVNMPQQWQLNGHLYRAAKGYPMNLGLSEKVPTLPKEALGDTAKMRPRPQITRNIFTNRSYSSAPSIPAKPQAR